MKRKLLSIVLSIAVLSTMLAGCGGDTSTSTITGSTETPEGLDTSKHVTLKWYLCGNQVSDDKAVMEKVNEYLNEKLNVTLEPIWGTWGDFDEGSTLAVNGSDDVDIYFTASWGACEYNANAMKGAWVRLDDPENNILENYASESWNQLPDVVKEAAEVEGAAGKGIYALPVYKDYAEQNTWDINVTLLKKYGYTLDDIKNTDYYGFGDILKTVKEGEGPDFYPLLVESMVLERMVTNSVIVNGDSGSNNVLSYYMDPTDPSKDIGSKIVNKFATPEYKRFVEKTREYYEAGYIDPGCANKQTANDLRTAAQLEGKYLIGTQSYSLGYEAQTSAERHIEVAYVPCTPPYSYQTSAQGAMMAISTVSKNPDRAMAFLNLVNTDPYLMNLLAYGLEGTHYTLDEDGLVVFNDEARNTYMPWKNGLGNVTNLIPLAGEGKDFYQDVYIPYYNSSKSIPAFGYAFDHSSVETELAALANVAEQYALALDTGAVDPDTVLPEFLDKLEKAGMSKVVDEANAQLDAYFANEK